MRRGGRNASCLKRRELPWQGRLPFFYGWVIVALGFFTSFFGIGLTWAASIFAVPMRDELGWSRSEIFFAVSMRGWIGIVAAPVVGRYLDQRNGVRIMTLIGRLMNAASLLLISRSTRGGSSCCCSASWAASRKHRAASRSPSCRSGSSPNALRGAHFDARRRAGNLTLPLFLAPLIDSVGWREAGWSLTC